MSQFAQFMKKNKKVQENVKYAPTKSLCDEDGEPLEFEIRRLTTRENDQIREECTKYVNVGKKMQSPRLDNSKYLAKLIVAAIVFPNLHDKELQDSYGVMSAEDLIVEMIDNPLEYSDLVVFSQNLNGFTDLDEEIETAKN